MSVSRRMKKLSTVNVDTFIFNVFVICLFIHDYIVIAKDVYIC